MTTHDRRLALGPACGATIHAGAVPELRDAKFMCGFPKRGTALICTQDISAAVLRATA